MYVLSTKKKCSNGEAPSLKDTITDVLHSESKIPGDNRVEQLSCSEVIFFDEIPQFRAEAEIDKNAN